MVRGFACKLRRYHTNSETHRYHGGPCFVYPPSGHYEQLGHTCRQPRTILSGLADSIKRHAFGVVVFFPTDRAA